MALLARIAVLLIALGLSWHTATTALFHGDVLKEDRVTIDRYMDGAAHKPFAFRMLVPAMLNTLDAVTPADMDAGLDELSVNLLAGNGPFTTGPENLHPRAVLWLVVIDTICVFGFALVGASLFRRLFPDTRWNLAAPILFLLLVNIVVEQWFHHVYDFTALLLMAWLFWAMVREKHLVFLALFALSCVNKETTIFATFGYAAIFWGRMPRARLLTMLGVQLAIFAAVYFIAHALYANNEGESVEIWIREQFYYLRTQHLTFYIASAVNLFLLSYRWGEKPQVLKRATIMVALNFALFAVGGYPGEFRVFYDVYVILCLLVLRNAELLVRGWRGEPKSNQQA